MAEKMPPGVYTEKMLVIYFKSNGKYMSKILEIISCSFYLFSFSFFYDVSINIATTPEIVGKQNY